MKKISRKKLNNKGFTLVELLAVVVILAIVMGIAATSVLNSINNSRISTLYSTAQNAANTLNTWITEDMITTTDANRKLGDNFIRGTQTNEWICLGDVPSINNADGNAATSVKLIDALGIVEADIVLGSSAEGATDKKSRPDGSKLTKDNEGNFCSALKYNKSTGGYEFLLIARQGGKYYVSSDDTHFAYSRATGPNQAIAG